jgi:N-acetylneuraminic acid mutarotase
MLGRSTSLPLRSYVDGGLACDRKNKVFVLFGGAVYNRPLFNDTWTFNPATKEWREVKPPASPPARSGHKLLWHDKLGALVMAGGNDGKNRLNDLWVYETAAERWTEVKTPTAPPPGNAATCYDASQDVVVLFNQQGQTWALKIERH